jgi:hypothetical protein
MSLTINLIEKKNNHFLCWVFDRKLGWTYNWGIEDNNVSGPGLK